MSRYDQVEGLIRRTRNGYPYDSQAYHALTGLLQEYQAIKGVISAEPANEGSEATPAEHPFCDSSCRERCALRGIFSDNVRIAFNCQRVSTVERGEQG